MTDRNPIHSRMLAGKLTASRPLWKGNFTIGSEFTNSFRDEDYIPVGNDPLLTESNMRINENNTAFFGEITQRFGIVTARVGLRYEHTNSQYFENDVKQTEQCRKYDDFMPSVMITFPVKRTNFQLTYNRYVGRPLYGQLGSAVSYVNPYTYETGNPYLKTWFTNKVSLDFLYKWLIVSASYVNRQRRLISSFQPYGDNPEIQLTKKVNSERPMQSIELDILINPGMIGSFYTPSLTVGASKNFDKIEYHGGFKSMNLPLYLVRFNNIFTLPHNYMLTASFNFRSNFEMYDSWVGKTWQINFSASKTFNKNWELTLNVNDIFNSAAKSQYIIYSGWYRYEKDRESTTRSISLTLRYKFNVPKERYKGKGAGNSERERL